MFNCPNCQREFASIKSLSTHFTRVEVIHYKSRSDADYALAKNVYGEVADSLIEDYISEKICCDDLSKDNKNLLIKYLTSSGLKRCHSDEKKTQRYRNKITETIRSKYGDEYSSISQVPDIQFKKIETIKKNHGTYDAYLQKNRVLMFKGFEEYNSDDNRKADTLKKQKLTMQERYGVDNPSKIPQIALKSSVSQKARLSLLSEDDRRKMTEKARAGIKFESSIEKRIQEILVAMGVDFKKHIFIGSREYDLLISDSIIIEINGDYWHANPEIYKESDVVMFGKTARSIWEKDRLKKTIAEQHGFKFSCIWESDILKASDEALVSLLQKVIYDA